ncbi:MAG: heparinase II/III family protein [Bacteroidales bacterium]|nr:heparinase II/III family protein [Bacteroidales bacterium]
MKKALFLVLSAIFVLTACQSAPKAASTSADESPLILLNRKVLERVKHDIARQNPDLMPAFNALTKAADGYLQEEPLSVMMKKQTAPSGSKHDYVSRAPYWWPDASKADGLPYIRKDGERNPELDDFTDHIYLSKLCNMVSKLALAYYFTGREAYAEKAAVMLRTWFLDDETKMNPNLNYAQQIPGVTDGRGIGIIETPCIAEMLDYVILLQASPAWTEADNAGLKNWIGEYLEWLVTSKNGKDEAAAKNNHGSCYDYQVMVYSIFTEKKGEARNRLEKVTKARLDSQLAADGLQPLEYERTRPWHYCSENLIWFAQMGVIGERIGVNLWEYVTPKGASIRKAIEWFFPYLDGTKTFEKSDVTGVVETKNLAKVLLLCNRMATLKYKDELGKLMKYGNEKFDLQSSVWQLTFPIIYGPVLSDGDLFDELNLDFPGMEDVKKAVVGNDYDQARKALAAYLRTRSNHAWFFDWNDFGKPETRDADYDRSELEPVMRHYFGACSIPMQFGDTIDWSVNASEIKYQEWTWQLSRHPYWGKMGEAYWATGDEQYAREWVKQFRSWQEQCPVPDHEGSPLYSRWRTLESGIRTSGVWFNAFYRFLPSPTFDDESVVWFMKSCFEHAVHLRKHHKKGNWLTHEMNGLFNIGQVFPEFKQSAAWSQYAADKLYREQTEQFYPDGSQKELAPGYHGVCLVYINGLYNSANLFGYKLPDNYITDIEPFYEYYQKIMMPDGCTPALNDAGWNESRGSLAKGYELFPQRADFQYSATAGKEGVKPAYTSVWMPWAGWYVMRTGWGPHDMYAHFEVGPYSIGHQHEDKLSIILHAYGNRLLTEGGVYAYDTSQWRKYILSARAHNVTRVDGMDQNRRGVMNVPGVKEIAVPLDNRWITNDRFDFGEGWYDEGFGENNDKTVTQYRALAFIKNKYWILFDIFTPTDQKEHEYQTWFHFDTSEHTTYAPLRAVASKYADGEPNIVICQTREDAAELKVVTGQEQPEVQGWVPTGGAQKYACRQVATPIFTRRQVGQCVEPYILYPVKAGENQPIAKVEMKDETIRLTYKDGKMDVIKYNVCGNSLKLLSVTTDGNTLDILK